MERLVSIIVPVYNAEKYVRRCVDSILVQDYPNFELILMDDGSTDGSGEICDAYAGRDERVRVIHKENTGVSDTRNQALELAEGEYIQFLDSDDWIVPEATRLLVQAMEKNGCDMVISDFYRVAGERLARKGDIEEARVLNRQEFAACMIENPADFYYGVLWNKLYKRKLYDGVFFEEGRKIDDEFFTYQALLKPCKVVRRETIVYNYRKRASSVMSRPESANQRLLDCLDAIVSRREKVLAVYPELKYAFDENYLDTLWYLSGNFGCTRETIALLKWHLKAYLRTKGNRLPPRYMWPMILRMFFVIEEKMA